MVGVLNEFSGCVLNEWREAITAMFRQASARHIWSRRRQSRKAALRSRQYIG